MKPTRFVTIVIAILFVAAYTPHVYSSNLYLDVKVKSTGEIDVSGRITSQGSTSSSAKMFLVPLPFSLKSNALLETAQDVKLAVASSGNGYTLLSLIAETTGSPISFGIKSGIKYTETSEGKAKIELFPSYKYMTQVERSLISQSIVITKQDITIQLPRQYNPTEIGFRPLTVKTSDNQKFVLPQVSIPDSSGNEYWIVFPNPATEDLKWAQIIISFLFGFFTIAFHVPALRKGNLTWQVFVLVLSSIILAVSIYFTFSLSKKLDFGLFIAAASPHVLFGLLATLWLLLTKRYRALITGTVHKNGAPILFATVTLEQKKGAEFDEIKSATQLNDNGRFSFSVLLLKEDKGIYRISAQMVGAQNVITNEFELSRAQSHEEHIVLVPVARESAL